MSEMMIQNERVPEPIEALRGVRAYSVNRHPAPVELDLDANERTVLPDELLGTFRAIEADTVRKYPEIRELESAIAKKFGIATDRVLATAGGDEAIDRICRAYLGPGREIVLAVPTFEMIERYASMVGAGIKAVDWPSGAFPTSEVCAAMTEDTGVVAIVSPNNPTGSVATVEDFLRVAETAASIG
ncbi:MAG: aminotransferase class I/II-fold pyridoxal phosphate-dependent enzyme, partial [Planctomycetota bacterium]